MPTVEFNDNKPALAYIKERGYASYSSIKNVRDCIVPSVSNEIWYTFGKELHSRLLEGKVIQKLSPEEEKLLTILLAKLRAHPIVRSLLLTSVNEIDFGPKAALKKYDSKNGLVVPDIMGLPIYGRIDIYNKKDNVSDLKTTKLTNMAQFIAAMDFLQAAIYLAATGCRDFYYIGISKVAPYSVMVFNVRQYPERLAAAQVELKKMCKFINARI